MPDFDVLIVGGGPAGSAAGLALLQRRDMCVGLLEASDYVDVRVGEALSPGARPLLDYLGLWDRFRADQALESFGYQAAWGRDALSELDFLTTTQGSGWSLDRVAFDRMLAAAFAERGGRLHRQTRFRNCERSSDGIWRVNVHTADGQNRQLRTRYLIDASGRKGLVGRAVGASRQRYDDLVGVARIGVLKADAQIAATVQVESFEHGWWYSAPLPGGRIAVVLMTDIDLLRAQSARLPDGFEALLAHTQHTSVRVAELEAWRPIRTFSAASSISIEIGGDGWVAIGDAASAHDPLASIGIPNALGSGIQGAIVAADALLKRGDALTAYRAAVRQDYQRYLQTRWNTYRQETRWPGALFWRRRCTPVTLAPETRLQYAEQGAIRLNEAISSFLSPGATHRLLKECASPRPAYEVARHFANRNPALPDDRIVLALQDLLHSGQLKIIENC